MERWEAIGESSEEGGEGGGEAAGERSGFCGSKPRLYSCWLSALICDVHLSGADVDLKIEISELTGWPAC